NNTSGHYNTFIGTLAGEMNKTGDYNTYLGQRAGNDNVNGSHNVFLGFRAGYRNLNSGSVLIGHRAGYNEQGANKLYIANSNTNTPLIYGEFDNQVLNINGSLGIGIKNPARPLHIRHPEAILRIDRDQSHPGLALLRYEPGFNQIWKSFVIQNEASGKGQGRFVIGDLGIKEQGQSEMRFVVANSGNIGIGNFIDFDPSHKLSVLGNVLAVNYLSISDKRLKQNIQPIPQAMDKLMRVKGVTYQFNRKGVAAKGISPGQQLGLIAQEVEKVFPELVEADDQGYKAINYIGLIPVLIEALKEQEARHRASLQQLQVRIDALTNRTQEISDPNENSYPARLIQNQPNPFDNETQINFFLPDTIKEAWLFIYNMQGNQIKKLSVMERGSGQILLKAHSLSPGIYFYALVADGQEVGMYRMLLTK
ncbi:MAG: tail fiber domain-containing protein, partial [Bacteroidota bacterium]